MAHHPPRMHRRERTPSPGLAETIHAGSCQSFAATATPTVVAALASHIVERSPRARYRRPPARRRRQLGVAIFPTDGADVDDLLANADWRSIAPRPKGAAPSASSRPTWPRNCASAASCSMTCNRPSPTTNSARLPAAGADRRRDRRVRSACPLAPSEPRPGRTRQYSSRSPKRTG